MANKKDKETQKANRRINKLGSFIQSNLDKLYNSIYYSQPTNKQDLDTIKSKLDDSIDAIVLSNRDNTGKATMSSLYSRAIQSSDDKLKGNEGRGSESLESLLNDKNIMDTGMLDFINDTTTIFDYDNKIDTILKYMPKLEEALDCRKDNVLSADHFSKDFINVINNNCSGDSASYNEHIKDVKERYNFQELADKIYNNASKYGEQFVYVVPTQKAISRLLKIKDKGLLRADLDLKECKFYNIDTGESVKLDPINESVVIKEDSIKKSSNNKITNDDLANSKYNGLQIEIDKSGMISSIVEDVIKYQKTVNTINEMSLNFNEDVDYSIITEAGDKLNKITNSERVSDKVKGRFDKTINDDLSFDNFDYNGQDGLIDRGSVKNKSKKKQKVEVPGTIIRLLDRKRVIPLYIEDKCFGYYYIESEGQYNPVGDYDKMTDPTMSLKGSSSILSTNSVTDQASKQNGILRYLSNQISQFIDANFVNSNQDLRDEIYMILKYNEQNNISKLNKLKVTFIPPEDMEHVYFKMNDKTHRGISDLDKAMFPATLYSAMYITNCIWTMTRSQDKRVYYVKQTVDTNISKTLLNTIEQIKKGNMNIRQIENINNIMNITGQFNDYVIPKNSSGESPIDFEVMQGQTIEFKTELMTTLEEMAVNSTDVPMEMIQMRQSVEYATQLSMSSSKFLRKVYNRQSKYQKNLTRIFSKLYANEYNDDNITLEVKLPPPMFLNITNTNQMITNVTDYSASVADIMVDDTDESVKKYVIRELNKSNLGSYLDIDNLEEIVDRAKQLAARDNNSDNEE